MYIRHSSFHCKPDESSHLDLVFNISIFIFHITNLIASPAPYTTKEIPLYWAILYANFCLVLRKIVYCLSFSAKQLCVPLQLPLHSYDLLEFRQTLGLPR